MEEAQGTTVEALIRRITNYGSRRVEDFYKYAYAALRLAEDLDSVAKTSGNAKAASYEIIASTLREKVSVLQNILRPIFWPFSRIRNFLVSLIPSLRSINLLNVHPLINEAPNLAEEDFP